jgi:hypothetical protein
VPFHTNVKLAEAPNLSSRRVPDGVHAGPDGELIGLVGVDDLRPFDQIGVASGRWCDSATHCRSTSPKASISEVTMPGSGGREISPYVTPQIACDSSVEKLASQRGAPADQLSLGGRVAAGEADSFAGRVNPTPPTLPAAYGRRIFDVGLQRKIPHQRVSKSKG